MRITALTKIFLRKFIKKHGVFDVVFPGDLAPRLKAALHHPILAPISIRKACQSERCRMLLLKDKTTDLPV